ncbi:MAG: protein kinase [Anaerolineales bacterium]|nr:protein kinase [Anaerolineales bacterium]
MAGLIGHSLGRYQILERLGEGGMATVYRARDPQAERDVAVKIIRRSAFPAEQFDRILHRFRREARALRRLSHPGIVAILDHGEHAGTAYLVLEYVPGGTVKDRLDEPMPWQEAVRLLLPVAQALAYAHSQGIIHRDVKPSNILLNETGQPLLTDFGIAKLLETEATQTLTGTGMGVGTPEYMAPEQGLGGEIDSRVDIYSLGIVFYELVTGHRPFTADTPMAVIVKHINTPLPSPRRFIPELPEKVEAVMRQALAKNPAERYPSMGAFALALEGLPGGRKRTAARAGGETGRAPETFGTLHQEDTRLTRVQEALPDPGEPERAPGTPGPGGPARRPWWPWLLGGALLAGLGCIMVAALVGGSLMLPRSASRPTAARPGVPTATSTTASRPTATRSGGNTTTAQTTCPGAPPQRIEVGDHIYVCTQSDTVAMRSGPGRAFAIIHRMQPDAEFEVIGGPECGDDWTWWEVRSTTSGYTGWMAEGGDSVDPYFLCPGYP